MENRAVQAVPLLPDPSLNATMSTLTVSWHVHPSGTGWVQPPSAQDQTVAAGETSAVPGMIHVVVGAGNKQVYFYNGDGKYQQMSLKKFMGTP
jgi:hypothetical protein